MRISHLTGTSELLVANRTSVPVRLRTLLVRPRCLTCRCRNLSSQAVQLPLGEACAGIHPGRDSCTALLELRWRSVICQFLASNKKTFSKLNNNISQLFCLSFLIANPQIPRTEPSGAMGSPAACSEPVPQAPRGSLGVCRLSLSPSAHERARAETGRAGNISGSGL